MTEEDITIKIKADTSDFAQGMEDATKKTEEFAKTTEKASNSTKNFKGISGAAEKVQNAFEGFSALKGDGKGKGGLGGIFDGLKSKFMGIGMSAKMASAGAIGVIVAGIGLIGKLAINVAKKVFSIAGQMTKAFDPAGYEKYTNKMNASITKLKTSLGAVLEPLYQGLTSLISWVADMLNGFFETILKIYAYIVGFLGLTGAISRNGTEYADAMEEATSSADAGLASFDKLTTLNTDGMGDAAQSERIRNMMADAAEAADSMRNSIWDALNPMKHIASLFDSLDLKSKWNGFIEAGQWAWGQIVDGARDLWNSLTSLVTSFFDSIFNFDYSGIFDGLLNAFKGVINTFASIWNNTVANIGFEIGIPDWVPFVGGQKWGFNTYGLKIPYLAKGTVADPNDPYLAVIGDNPREKEVVSPLSTIEDAVRNVLTETGGNGVSKIELTVNLDGRKIARGVYDYIEGEARRRGQSWQS